MMVGVKDTPSSFKRLEAIVKEAGVLEGINSLLGYDEQTNMPSKGVNARGEMKGVQSRLVSELWQSEKMEITLKEIEIDLYRLEEHQLKFFERVRAIYQRAKAIPPELVEESERLKSQSFAAWKEARAKSDFRVFLGFLKKVYKMARQFADLYGYDDHPLDALLPDFEPGMTTEMFTKIIDELIPQLKLLLGRIQASPLSGDNTTLQRPYIPATQMELSQELLKLIGVDMGAAKLDVSTHPFTTWIGPNDTRLTTRFEKRCTASLFSALHEGGHTLYCQSLDPSIQWFNPPKGISMALHECWSRLFENVVGRSEEFWRHAYPILCHYYPYFRKVHLDDFLRAINKVEPSFIRVEADEVTYQLHIILRFELERDLLAGEVKVEELPEIWRAKMKEYLGIVPPDDAKGVLQDVHWSQIYIGYFPSYMLGNLYAAAVFRQALNEIPRLRKEIAVGNLKPLLKWMKFHFRHGYLYTGPELIQKITSKGPSAQPYLRYIREKFNELYSIYRGGEIIESNLEVI